MYYLIYCGLYCGLYSNPISIMYWYYQIYYWVIFDLYYYYSKSILWLYSKYSVDRYYQIYCGHYSISIIMFLPYPPFGVAGCARTALAADSLAILARTDHTISFQHYRNYSAQFTHNLPQCRQFEYYPDILSKYWISFAFCSFSVIPCHW